MREGRLGDWLHEVGVGVGGWRVRLEERVSVRYRYSCQQLRPERLEFRVAQITRAMMGHKLTKSI